MDFFKTSMYREIKYVRKPILATSLEVSCVYCLCVLYAVDVPVNVVKERAFVFITTIYLIYHCISLDKKSFAYFTKSSAHEASLCLFF